MDWTLNLSESLCGGPKKHYIFQTTKYNLGNLYENPYLIKHVKVEEMVHIDTCYAILENIVNSILCSILSRSQILKSGQNLPFVKKQLKNQLLVNTKNARSLIKYNLMWNFWGYNDMVRTTHFPDGAHPIRVFKKWNYVKCSIHF